MRDLYISRIGLTIMLQPNMWTDPGNIYKSLTDTRMWKLGTEAAQFPQKEYISGIFVAVHAWSPWTTSWERQAPRSGRSGRMSPACLVPPSGLPSEPVQGRSVLPTPFKIFRPVCQEISPLGKKVGNYVFFDTGWSLWDLCFSNMVPRRLIWENFVHFLTKLCSILENP